MHNKISMPIINGIDGSAWVDVSDYSLFPGMARESGWIWLTFMDRTNFYPHQSWSAGRIRANKL